MLFFEDGDQRAVNLIIVIALGVECDICILVI
jgi:hypothetical protein